MDSRGSLAPPVFADERAYGQRFTDVDFWQPYVQAVCRRHGLPYSTVRGGVPGTHPVYLVDGRYAVKFFTHFFNGAERFAMERELQARLSATPGFPTTPLVAEGSLFSEEGGWPWPYMVTEVLPGRSLTEERGVVTFANEQAVAAWLGPVVRRLHDLPLQGLLYLQPGWDDFAVLMTKQRANCAAKQRRLGSLPERLIEQIEDYVPSVDALIDRSRPPKLLHADLNADHVLGKLQGERWQPTGIIDFGDARVGDLYYELIAMHLGLFDADTRLLRTFLASYGWPEPLDERFVHKAMSYALLFEFDAFRGALRARPALGRVATLDGLARLLWT